MAAEISIDPEFRDLLPIRPESRRQLEDNISAEGVRDPLVVWRPHNNGQCILVDGYNRKDIADRLGLKYKTVECEFADRLAVRIWIRRNQAGRRNFTDDQRAMNAAALAEDLSEQAKLERAKAGRAAGGDATPEQKRKRLSATVSDKRLEPTRQKKDSRKSAAAELKVPERKIKKAQSLRKASPALAAKVASGELSLSAACKQSVKAEKARAKSSIPADLPAATDRYRLVQCDIAKAASEVESASVDWIITDPPYPKKFLPLFASLAEFAEHALKPGGGLLAMVGQSYLPEIMAAMGRPGLFYHWTIAYLTPGGQAVQLWDRKVNTFWKPVLWYVKGKHAGDWIGDVAKSAVNDNDKNHHDWGQSESGMADLIERFTYPGQTIVDPFLGGGTTGVVAIRMNRRFVGLDVDADAVAVARKRMAAWQSPPA